MDMPQIPKRTASEQETLLRWDEQDHELLATTTVPRVAARWQRAGYAPRVLSTYPGGAPASWEVRVAWTGRKAPWLRLVRLGLSQWRPVPHRAHAAAHAPEGVARRGKGSGRVHGVDARTEAPGA
jgi:hypothetical protein